MDCSEPRRELGRRSADTLGFALGRKGGIKVSMLSSSHALLSSEGRKIESVSKELVLPFHWIMHAVYYSESIVSIPLRCNYVVSLSHL